MRTVCDDCVAVARCDMVHEVVDSTDWMRVFAGIPVGPVTKHPTSACVKFAPAAVSVGDPLVMLAVPRRNERAIRKRSVPPDGTTRSNTTLVELLRDTILATPFSGLVPAAMLEGNTR